MDMDEEISLRIAADQRKPLDDRSHQTLTNPLFYTGLDRFGKLGRLDAGNLREMHNTPVLPGS